MKQSKKIDEIMKRRFFRNDNEYYHRSLCIVPGGTEFKTMWELFWRKINTKRHKFSYDYFKGLNVSKFETALLGLVIVEDFKRYCEEEK